MATLNTATILGRMVRDPEIRMTKTGKQVCQFTVAFDKRGKDAGANFLDVVAWESKAEYISKYGSKGALVLLRGRLDQETWEKDGKKNSKFVLIADEAQLLSRVEAKEDKADVAPTVDEFDKEVGNGAVSMDDIPF